MTARGFACFDTPIGTCAIAWGRAGIVRVELPGRTTDETRQRMQGRYPDAQEARPPPGVELAVRDMTRLLGGLPENLSRIALDMEGLPHFHVRVYQAARTVMPGHTTTYGAIARSLGQPGAARAVGRALAENPFAIVVPCHRVLGADGKAGGFSAAGGVTTKVKLLAIEGAWPEEPPCLFDAFGGLPLATPP